MSFCGGLAGFVAGFIRKAVGYHMLANLGDIAAAFLLVAAFYYLRTAARGAANPTLDPSVV